jgi:hypothetical protein
VGKVDWPAESDLNSRRAVGKVDWPAESYLNSRGKWGKVTGLPHGLIPIRRN